MSGANNQQQLADLLTRIATGDRLAFRAFYAATAPLLYAYALRLRVSGALAEDVVQDTYLRIWRYARGYDAARGASPTTWAIQILRNRAVDLRVAQGPATTPLDDDTAADAMVGFNTGNAMSERLTACFNNLGGRYRQVL
ncbi:MAG TPA: RNA polymerase sigma factor, partial [Burkholderiaceae bacterium]|nr:RNA polymerase sigma factor [Burkholderiaceae bacterium]